jgi:hypothetical protein
VTGDTVELAYVDQGYTGAAAAEAAAHHGIQLEVVKHPMAKRGFVLLLRHRVVERSFAWGRTIPNPHETTKGSIQPSKISLSLPVSLILTRMFHLLNATS